MKSFRELLSGAIALALALALPLCALAEEFPEGAAPVDPAQLAQHLGGKTFTVKLKDGNSWRVEYKSNGYFFFNHSLGASDTGQWRGEESKLCTKGLRLISASCNEVRMKDGALVLKRDNGDVIQFVEKQ